MKLPFVYYLTVSATGLTWAILVWVAFFQWRRGAGPALLLQWVGALAMLTTVGIQILSIQLLDLIGTRSGDIEFWEAVNLITTVLTIVGGPCFAVGYGLERRDGIQGAD